MAVFGRVVDKGTFRAAAKDLGLAPSRVSQTVSDLEQYLGITLFYRSTRKLSLTDKGRQFYAHISEMMRSAESGLNELNVSSQKPSGTLKITLPAFLEHSSISFAIADFIKKYNDVSLSLNYTDQHVDILDAGLDLRIRAKAGGIEDSAMMSRKIGEIQRLLVTSKVYFNNHTIPQHPRELKKWDWINFQMRSTAIEFISPENETVSITGNSYLSVNSVNALQYFVNQHIGISILPENLAANGLKSGELVHVLPNWRIKPLECYAIWPDKSLRKNLTMIFVSHLIKSVPEGFNPNSAYTNNSL